jgi:hypothetical protein
MDDCVICVVAMVMGYPFTYERVLKDSDIFPKTVESGKFPAWWETYLAQESFETQYRPFIDLYKLPISSGNVRGILGMDIPELGKGHVVAVDEVGIVDPAHNAPDHVTIQEYVLSRLGQRFKFHKEFLAVWKKPGR